MFRSLLWPSSGFIITRIVIMYVIVQHDETTCVITLYRAFHIELFIQGVSYCIVYIGRFILYCLYRAFHIVLFIQGVSYCIIYTGRFILYCLYRAFHIVLRDYKNLL